jgi:hypothetical protein
LLLVIVSIVCGIRRRRRGESKNLRSKVTGVGGGGSRECSRSERWEGWAWGRGSLVKRKGKEGGKEN